ncbi:3-hydroxyisobutyrate dehydrogenase-related beta-hydroxyacid dehydrogenase [Gordonia sp. KTR9]|nr:3-hydroxyisobutyrate dehydrogenase-related beta-hydroxyacid dehydrogenase [Gordonia sp. KTR9]
MKVGFIGAGRMGWPMVRRLRAGGHEVILSTRRPEVRAAAEEVGVTVTDSVRDIGDEVALIITCFFSVDQLHDVVHRQGLLEALGPASTLVSHATGAVDALQDISTDLRAAGHRLVDAPVSGTADDIDQGALTVLIAGDPVAVDGVDPVLRSYARAIVACGNAVGDAQKVKLVNNLLFAASSQIAVQAAHFAASLGVDPALMLRAVGESSGNSYALEQLRRFGDTDSFVTGVGPFLRKDVGACLALADELDVDPGCLSQLVESGPIGDLTG